MVFIEDTVLLELLQSWLWRGCLSS